MFFLKEVVFFVGIKGNILDLWGGIVYNVLVHHKLSFYSLTCLKLFSGILRTTYVIYVYVINKMKSCTLTADWRNYGKAGDIRLFSDKGCDFRG